jgi:hypothetical protein
MSTPSPLEEQARKLFEDMSYALQPILDGVRHAVAPIAADPRLKDGQLARALIRDQLRELCGETEPDGSAGAVAQNELAQERVDAIMAFIDLAREHSLPRKLLPRGDRIGEEFQVGERVTVMNHSGTVEPATDVIRVRLDTVGHAVDFPRRIVHHEGEGS